MKDRSEIQSSIDIIQNGNHTFFNFQPIYYRKLLLIPRYFVNIT